MRRSALACVAAALLVAPVSAGEIGDQLPQRLYEGTLGELREDASDRCVLFESDACFALGMIDLTNAYEGLARAMYRHGAVAPDGSSMAMILGMDELSPDTTIANPDPQPLTYEELRFILESFSGHLAIAAMSFQMADVEGTDFVIHIDPLKVRLDLDGDGTRGEGETLASIMGSLDEMVAVPGMTVEPPPGGKTKTRQPGTDQPTTIGFDRADAVWLAGYATATRAPVELLLAHDFSEFFDAYLHRVFPRAGLPMQDYSSPADSFFTGGDGDTMIADIIAAVHMARFPVTDKERLAGVLEQLQTITRLSRRNWHLIQAETDDDRELLPSPDQTSIVPDMRVTQNTVDAWMATLDTLDEVLAGELLVPHWRFRDGGIDLKAYFETAEETDVVMFMTGHGLLPFLKDGPVADAESFAEANDAFGTEWLNYAIWFN